MYQFRSRVNGINSVRLGVPILWNQPVIYVLGIFWTFFEEDLLFSLKDLETEVNSSGPIAALMPVKVNYANLPVEASTFTPL